MEAIMNNNRIIAEFMGYKVLADTEEKCFVRANEWGVLHIDDFDLQASWDSLMSIVKKIEFMNKETGFMGVFTLFGLGRTKVQCYKNEVLIHEIDILGERYGIQPTYKAVVEFIKWYNANKK